MIPLLCHLVCNGFNGMEWATVGDVGCLARAPSSSSFHPILEWQNPPMGQFLRLARYCTIAIHLCWPIDQPVDPLLNECEFLPDPKGIKSALPSFPLLRRTLLPNNNPWTLSSLVDFSIPDNNFNCSPSHNSCGKFFSPPSALTITSFHHQSHLATFAPRD